MNPQFAIQDGKIIPVEELQQPTYIKKQIYEVLRVIDGKPLFWEDHYQRFLDSLTLLEWNGHISDSSFKDQLQKLITVNNRQVGNIRIDLFIGGEKDILQLAFIPHKYPSENDYIQGIPVGVLHGERENPHVKAVQSTLRDRANEMIAQQKLYEVLLVDQLGMIAEGSRSNVFFIKGEKIHTPLSSKVLLGITRMKVLECIEKLGFIFREVNVSEASLNEYDAVFLTGTSPKVLPVSTINSYKFDVENSALRKLMKEYDLFIENYLIAF